MARWNLPKDVLFCTRCVLSNQRPMSRSEYNQTDADALHTIPFDAEGVCLACRMAEYKGAVDWKARGQELEVLLAQYRREDGRPDVVVPGSGGKDSVFAAWKLKHEYGMHPLCVTWSPHLYTDWGWRNLRRWSDHFDHVLFTPNGETHRKLTRAAFDHLLHPFQPFTVGQKILAKRIARQYNIPLVMYGEGEEEYGGKIDWKAQRVDPPKAPASLTLSGLPISQLQATYKISDVELWPYLEDPNASFIHVYQLGYFIRWIPQESYYYAVEKVGFEPSPTRTPGTFSTYNSIDDKMDDCYYVSRYIKFGLGRATSDAAQEIRNGHLTREEGIALVRKFDHEFPMRFFKETLKYLDVTENQFWETVDRFRPPHLWENTTGEWMLKHVVK